VSAANVEVVRRLYETLGEATRKGELRDFSDTPVAAELLDPEVEWHGTVGGLAEGAVARGRDGIARFMYEDSQEWEEVVFEPTEFVDVGDRVVVLQHERRRGRHSGLQIEADTASVIWLRDGRVRRIQGYMEREQALHAVGLGR
jgi:ketosteroid isomerase-like protein